MSPAGYTRPAPTLRAGVVRLDRPGRL